MSQECLRKNNGKKPRATMYFVVHFSLSIASKVDARSTSKAIGGDRAHQFPQIQQNKPVR